MPAWLKQLDPTALTARRIPLEADHRLGRSARLVHDRFWRLITREEEQVLHPGQLFSIDGVDYVFGEPDEHHQPAMEAAIAADPHDRQAKQVYADWLLEHGDPLGERIVGPRSKEEDARWLEGLGPDEVEIQWRDGLVDRAVVRELFGAHEPGEIRRTLTRVLNLRAACFLRSLVVDVQGADPHSATSSSIAAHAAELAAKLPRMAALESLSLGYWCEDRAGLPAPLVLDQEDPRFPRLDPGPIFNWGSSPYFEVLEARALDGARKGDRLAAGGLRLRILGARAVLATVAEPRRDWTWASADLVNGRVLWSQNGDLLGIRVNGREAAQTFLLPGDVVEADPGVRLRFDLERR